MEKMMVPSLWILFGVREVDETTLPHPYFIGVYTSLEAANAARATAISNSSDEHPHSMYYVKEALVGVSHSYEWSTVDD